MADGSACLRPDMLLRIEVRTGGWEMDEVETRVGLEKIGHYFGGVPGGAAQEQENGLNWISQE